MMITDIKIRGIEESGRLKAVVCVTFDNELAVHDIKIIEGQDKYFLAMPSRKLADGGYKDIVHPITKSMREMLEKEVIEKYNAVFLDSNA